MVLQRLTRGLTKLQVLDFSMVASEVWLGFDFLTELGSG